eukprot:Nitzschia sp. Nitz4//scaffold269_size25945//7078//8808//NITZ4_008287-RA/size25945-processed-gene-0.25-mRNA-1//-1//CDS//3329544961//6602//frame0
MKKAKIPSSAISPGATIDDESPQPVVPVEELPCCLHDGLAETEEEVLLAEKILAQKLEQLSIEEQEQATFDVYGIGLSSTAEQAFEIERDEERRDQVLSDMQQALDQIVLGQQQQQQQQPSRCAADAYLQAMKWNPTYVTSQSLRLMFLRHSQFHPLKAAQFFLQHFHHKQRLFGDGPILGRPIGPQDLTSTDRLVVESGFAHILPVRDMAGRTVFCLVTAVLQEYEKELLSFSQNLELRYDPSLRAIWYLIMKVLELDEDTQRCGVVTIHIHWSDVPISLEQFQSFAAITDDALPYRVEAAHFCHSHSNQRGFATSCQVLGPDNKRPRSRVHHGTTEEISFALQTYGIPMEQCDFKDGMWNLDMHREWLATVQRLESKRHSSNSMSPTADEPQVIPPSPTDATDATDTPVGTSTSTTPSSTSTGTGDSSVKQHAGTISDDDGSPDIILIPRRFDVLFGRSKYAKEHTGTRRALHIILMHYETYHALGKYQKTDVAERIVSLIHESGGRFLRQDSQSKSWVEVDDAEAREKVSHWFRNVRQGSSRSNAP